ncbi:MAG: NUDIX domain-containing protein [Aggregatilineales bacterium]
MNQTLKKFKACGVICFREKPTRQFLLMKHPKRWDLPKGHVEDGETELQTALREMQEETGFSSEQVRIEPNFRWQTSYEARYAWLDNELVHKTVVIFLGWVAEDAELILTEHTSAQWIEWSPPHKIQTETVDPLLQAVDDYFKRVAT